MAAVPEGIFSRHRCRVAGWTLTLCGLAVALLPAQTPAFPVAAIGAVVQPPPTATDLHGDPLPPGAVARLGTARFRPGRGTWALAYSGDGKLLASAHDDNHIELWEAATGKHLGRLAAPGGARLTRLACSPDGKYLAAGDKAHGIWLWDLGTRKAPQLLKGHAATPCDLAFAPDSKTLASIAHKQGYQDQADFVVRLWDVAGGQAPREMVGHTDYPSAVAFLQDGKQLVSTGVDGTMRVWDTATGKELRQVKFKSTWPSVVRPGPGGHTVLLWTGWGYTAKVELWDASDFKSLRPLTEPGEGVLAICAAAPDGRHLAVVRESGLRIVEAATGKTLSAFASRPGQFAPVAFAPDGKRVAAATIDGLWTSDFRASGLIHVWDVATGKEAAVPASHRSIVGFVRFLPDGKTVLTVGHDDVASLWHSATGKLLHHFTIGDNPFGCDLSPDGATLAAPGNDIGSVTLWDVAKGQQRTTWSIKNGFWIAHLTFSPDGKMLAVSMHRPLRVDLESEGDVHIVCLVDTATGKSLGKLDVSTHACFSPDGRLLIVDGFDGVHVRHLATWKELQHWPGAQRALFVLPDNKTVGLTTGEREYGVQATGIALWNVQTGKETPCLPDGPGTLFMAISPDGDRVVLGPRWGHRSDVLHLRHLTSGWLLARLAGHRGDVLAAAFSPDGRLLATAGADCTTLIWDVATLIRLQREHQVPLAAAEIEALWTGLGDASPAKLLAMLDRLGEDRAAAVAFLGKRLGPVSDTDVERYVADLGSEVFAKRDKAMHELGRMEWAAAKPLQRVLAGKPSLELRQRVEKLLKALEEPAVAPWHRAAWRAVAVLEQMDTPEARQLLGKLAAGAPEARLTLLARAALDRLAKRKEGSRP
jgi:WD40 repeat protein